MRFQSNIFWQSKLNNSPDEYEDAARIGEGLSGAMPFCRAAIADGATESSFAQQWALLLVAAYSDGELSYDNYASRLPRLQQRWSSELASRQLPWYAQEKVDRGAFTAFLGLTLNCSSAKSTDGRWDSMAIGDCCMFQMRANQLICAWPLTHADQFNDRPVLLSSHPQFNVSTQDNILSAHGWWQLNDTFYLMTDALACWFLRAIGPTALLSGALKRFSSIATEVDFEGYIRSLRKAKHLKNDDTTLVRIDVI